MEARHQQGGPGAMNLKHHQIKGCIRPAGDSSHSGWTCEIRGMIENDWQPWRIIGVNSSKGPKARPKIKECWAENCESWKASSQRLVKAIVTPGHPANYQRLSRTCFTWHIRENVLHILPYAAQHIVQDKGADETLMSCGNQEFALWDCKESPGPSTGQHQAPGELLDPIYSGAWKAQVRTSRNNLKVARYRFQ